jgi:hypothetical protein
MQILIISIKEKRLNLNVSMSSRALMKADLGEASNACPETSEGGEASKHWDI